MSILSSHGSGRLWIIPELDQMAIEGGSAAPARRPGPWIRRPVSAVVGDLQRLAADLDRWYQRCGPEATVAFHDAVHAIHRAIVATQELDAAVEGPSHAELWIG